MITTALDKAVCYRFNTPRWAHQPTSGAGAAKQGGRLNRKGLEALYLSCELPTAAAEYQQLSPLLPPGTVVSYHVSLDKVVDFSAGYSPAWDSIWEDLGCDWRKLAFNDKVEPPSWVIGDICLEAGAKGVLFPSTVHPGGTNLVVYNTALIRGTDLVEPYDPDSVLGERVRGAVFGAPSG